MNALHPTAVLCLWASIAVFIQTLPAPWLWYGVLGVSFFAGVFARARFLKLARRIRILCGVTIVLFAMATPGIRLFPSLAWLPVTWDGLELGVIHAIRLLSMVALVAILLESLSVDELISALHHGLRVSTPLGVPADRIAVRLSLVLAAMERSDSGWRAWLLGAEVPRANGIASVDVRPLRPLDVACIILALGGLIGWGVV